jgi:uncharacterized CHY-type Zn-finger protein
MAVGGREVCGVDVGPETRCAHYDGETDVIAIKFWCCGDYYPCFRCHDAVADHDPERWPTDEFDRQAVLCGVCGGALTVREYLDADHECPDCGAGFNPGCAAHHDRYFEV